MAERGVGTTFSKLQQRVTLMKEKGDFMGNLQRLVDWKAKALLNKRKTQRIRKKLR
jgi:hypothetical protein